MQKPSAQQGKAAIYKDVTRDVLAVLDGEPDRIARSRVWVLPNPSGLNAHWSAAALAAEFARFREAAGVPAAKADRQRGAEG